MFSLLVIALLCGGTMGDSFFPKDLSTVKWEHAVNSMKKLEEALKAKDVLMLEADVSAANGTPIMAHPPETTSDLTLQSFLDTVRNDTSSKKGIKLDFKSTQAFNLSTPILEKFKDFKYPVWLNADILKGPGAAKEPSVDAAAFLSQAKAFAAWTLSVGWTTNDNGTDEYTQDDVTKMNNTLVANNIEQPVTFAVRAAIASKSDTSMKSLVNIHHNSTLTVWSSAADDKKINYTSLRKTIDDISRERVFVDMPQDQLKQLNSGSKAVLSSACVLLALGAFASQYL